MSSHEVLNLCWNVPNDPNGEGGCREESSEAQAPAEGPSSNQFEQGPDDDNLSTNGEDSTEVHFRTLKQDASSEAGPPSVEGVPPDVREANKTSGFLDSSGAVMPKFNFVVELSLEGLPEQELISLEFGFDDNITRSLLIYVDTTPVSVDIKQNETPKEVLNGEKVRHKLDVIFSTRIVGKPKEGNFSCTGVTKPLNSLIAAAQFSGEQHSLSPNHLMAVKNAVDKLSTCPTLPKKLDEASCVSLNGSDAAFISDTTGLDVCGFTNRRTPWTTVVTAEVSVEKGKRKDVTVTVNGDSVVSLFGTSVPRTNKTVNIGSRPDIKLTGTGTDASTSKSDSVAVMKKLGTTLSGLTGAAVGLSFVVSLGTPFLSFFTLADEPALMSELGYLSSAVDLMQIGQRVYLMTKIAAPNLPENFKAFGEQFSWTMLKFRDPWDKKSSSDTKSDTTHSNRRRLLGDDTSSGDDDIRDDPYSKFRGTYFWTGISLACAVVLHLVLLVIFFAIKGSIPKILRVPRLELYLSHTFIAIVAEGPAYLFGGNTRQVFIGVLVLAVGVIPLAVFYFLILRKYLFDDRRVEKRIVYIMPSVDVAGPANGLAEAAEPADDSPQVREPANGLVVASEPADDSIHGPEPANGLAMASERLNGSITQPLIPSTYEGIPREKIECSAGLPWFLDYILWPLLGRPYQSGNWTNRDKDAVRVIARYGPVFEDYRGKPMYQTNAQEEAVGETDGQCGEYEEVRAEYRYSIDVCEASFLLRISEKAMCLATQVFITVLILGEDDPSSNYQAVLILVVHCFYLSYLRFFRPHCSRWKLGVALFERMLDTFSLVLIVLKLNRDRESIHEDIGTILTVVEATEIAIQLIDMVVTLWPVCKEVKKLRWKCGTRGEEPSSPIDSTQDPNEDGFEERFCRDSARFLGRNVVQPVNVLYQSIRGERRLNSVHFDQNLEAAQNRSSTAANGVAEQPRD